MWLNLLNKYIFLKILVNFFLETQGIWDRIDPFEFLWSKSCHKKITASSSFHQQVHQKTVMTHEWSWRAGGGVIINLEELQRNLHGLNQQQPQNSFVFSEQALNQCCGSTQLPVSSSSNQTIQFKNPILLSVSCDQWQYHMTDSRECLANMAAHHPTRAPP